MDKKYLVLLCFFVLQMSYGQNNQGLIVYDRTLKYSKIIESLPYLSVEEKERQLLTWGKDDGWKSKYNLTFDERQAVFTYGKQEKEYSYSRRQDEFLFIDKLEEKKETRQFVLGGKLYVIKDENPKPKWKIKNEIREIAGFLCMKAVTQDTIKNQEIAAWFTDQIPISAGPEGFGGLPGMILMLDINDGTAIIEAVSVNFETPTHPIPKKIKGKEITHKRHNEILRKFFKQSIEGKRNPYWRLRY